MCFDCSEYAVRVIYPTTIKSSQAIWDDKPIELSFNYIIWKF